MLPPRSLYLLDDGTPTQTGHLCTPRQAHCGGINDNMQEAQASPDASPPRQKPSTLASIVSFAAFRSQTSQPVPLAVASQSPVRRKPLPADSPIAARFSRSNTLSSEANNDAASTNSTSSSRPAPVLSPPLTDEELFVPRNLDR